ncbi:conserved hypothetical protein [Nostocoides japonicum T1-X7]|uniref:DUF5926 domain-containing protein n=1 Tax=Nostocoides japonicum T1-X7 TaxID=1194083 RepID=A0A077LY77_9MICO|nr:DUF5926 family protein [Tetrasphaera japonica]CCH78606.1 conserved hypothetical protein [Tetrasphaera japonica T1-X7]
MGKASRRRHGVPAERAGRAPRARTTTVPFARRPFEGLPGETEWVAMREILPAATATVRLADDLLDDDVPETVTFATVLPLAWPGLRRAGGEVLVGMQSGTSSGDPSRDLATRLLQTLALEDATPLSLAAQPTADSPRLQDVVSLEAAHAIRASVHEGFDFWVADGELDQDAQESLRRANETVVPTERLEALPSAFWVRIGDRTFIRLVLGDDEDEATDALARLHAAGEDALGDGTRLLGAFRACGLLVPVWDLDPTREAGAHEEALAAFGERYATALAAEEALTPEERRARSGLLSRQVTLR